ncbi:MAG: ABC transporter ATP-binding protein [Gemmatimonadota bacterium]|nr:ABC transporter ATP-binding protein [Gemmatimonadota bacterium]
MTAGPILRVRDLRVHFPAPGGQTARAVDGVSFDLSAGETLALVGESGCGKSMTALSLVRLVAEPPAVTLAGSSIRLRGEELVGAPARRLREVRGAEIGFVFQEPMTSLDPVHRVGRQVEEAIRAHETVSRAEATGRTLALLERVGLPDPARAARAYPHQLSGGMRQRALIAIAIACGPSILLADEPTTALDVTVQAQILDLLSSLQREENLAVLLISHDLAVVSSVADRVAVMYGGRIVEIGPTASVLTAPRHPYGEGLLGAVPTMYDDRALKMIPGRVPAATDWPSGCRFHPRCPYAWDRCRRDEPRLADGVRCWLAEEPGRRGETTGFAEVST